jgi:hypothetical protein
MAAYTIRVELRGNPTYAEYERLHGVMSQSGFGRAVASGGKVYDLPHATYYGDVQADTSKVMEVIKAKVKNIQSNVVIFVAKTEDWVIGW